jgi:NTE family protein
MTAIAGPVDLVLSGGGILGIGHVGVAAVLRERGFAFQRIAGTSAGSIVGSLLAAGASPAELHELLCHQDFEQFLDADAIDRVPVIGPIVSIFAENGWAKGTTFRDWLFDQLAAHHVETFGDLEITDDPDRDPRPEHGWKLMVTAADVTTGELLRLPQDYRRYGLEPNDQFVADAVRASISVPYLFEPCKLRHADGTESLLVDGGLVSNYPLDAFNRTDGSSARWPTFGATVLPKLPAGDIELIPELSALRLIPGFHYLESLIVTAAFGRDQGYLEQPWISRWSIAVDSLGVNPFDFSIGSDVKEHLYESGRAAATAFLDRPAPAPGS